MDRATARQWLPKIWILVGLLAVSTTGSAQIYRCITPQGQTVFSDRSCGPDAQIHVGPGERTPTAPTSEEPPTPEDPAATEVEVQGIPESPQDREESVKRPPHPDAV
jgi:hypothetical protein